MHKPDRQFEDWYPETHRRLVVSLTMVFGNADIAHEAADEAIARAYERWDRVSSMANPVGWTYRVGLNQARRRLRRASMEAHILRRARPESEAAPAGELWHTVADLPSRQRQAVVLRHVGQLREVEIAEAMGITRGAVSATLRSAYRTLRVEIAEDEALAPSRSDGPAPAHESPSPPTRGDSQPVAQPLMTQAEETP